MKMPVRDIIRLSAEIFAVPAHQIYGPSRKQPIARARHAACEAALREGWPTTHVGKILARDRTSASHSRKQASALAEHIPDFASRRDLLARAIERSRAC